MVFNFNYSQWNKMETQPCVQYIHPFYAFKIMIHCFPDNKKREQDLKAMKSKKE